MVFIPRGGFTPYSGTANRAISNTTPNIQDEEDELLRSQARTAAANRVLSGATTQQVPSPMPTGNAAPPASPAKTALVNTSPAATTPPVIAPTMQPRMSGGTGSGLGDLTAGLDTSLAPTSSVAQDIAAAGASGMSRAPFAKVTSFTPDIFSGSGGGDGTVTTGTGETVVLPPSGTSREDQRNAAMGLFDGPPKRPIIGGGGAGGGGAEGDGSEKTFRSMLEETLMAKLGETPEERARRDAGRALVAARAQAGRGQMGMSGGMLALQSDVVRDAAARAEDRLFEQQLGAGRIGTQLEAIDKAEKLGILDYMETADFKSQAEAEKFLRDYLNMDDKSVEGAIGAAGLEGRIAPLSDGAAESQSTPVYGTPEADALLEQHSYFHDPGFPNLPFRIVDGRYVQPPGGSRKTGKTHTSPEGDTAYEYELPDGRKVYFRF